MTAARDIAARPIRWFCNAVLCCLAAAPGVWAADEDFAGEWMVSLEDGNRTLVGLLELERTDGEWSAFLEGGPARVEIAGDRITVFADSRDVRGFVFDREMTGTLAERGAARNVSAGWGGRAERRRWTVACGASAR